MKAPREIVRSGRRANFFIVENVVIDHYLRIVGATAFAVYCSLVRHADESRATFVGTAKLADESNLSQRQMWRILKTLEEQRLIRIVRTTKPVRKTVYWVLPVPQPEKERSAPLFDQCMPSEPVETVDREANDTQVDAAGGSDMGDSGQRHPCQWSVTPMSVVGDMGVSGNKEEQDSLNKRGERSPESQQPPSPIDLENRIATPPEDPYQLARDMMDKLGFPGGPTDLAVWSKRIKFEARDTGVLLSKASAEIFAFAEAAQVRGEFTKPTFWMKDYDRKSQKKKNAAVTLPEPASYQIRRELEQRRAELGR